MKHKLGDKKFQYVFLKLPKHSIFIFIVFEYVNAKI
jgi:hypothetical protein